MKKYRMNILALSILALSSLAVVESCKKSDDSTTVTPTSASVSALSCGSAMFSTSAVSGTAYTGTATIPYTGGNGVAYSAGSALASSGVTGLTATLQAGTLASGSGNLTYAISGTPSGAGTASFSLTFGGQICSLGLTVSSAGSTTNTTGNSSTVTTALSTTAASGGSSVAQLVSLTEAFKATLSSTQLTATQLSYTKANAQKWSNLPAGLSARNGVKTGDLTTTQLSALRNLLQAMLSLGVLNEGYDEMLGNMVADDYLNTIGGGSDYGAANFYISILGTPSTTGLWSILFTGHHYTQPYTFNAGAFTGVTPAFRGVEPAAAVTGAVVLTNPSNRSGWPLPPC